MNLFAKQNHEGDPSTQQTHTHATGSSNMGKSQLDASSEGSQDASSHPAHTRPRKKSDTVAIPNAGRMIAARIAQKNAKPGGKDSADYRHYLAEKSKDDLVDILMRMSPDAAELDTTDKLVRAQTIEEQAQQTETYQIPNDLPYHRLPVMRTIPLSEQVPAWRVVLISLDHAHEPLGLLIDGEITIGRTVGNTGPDLDLVEFDARRKGVSRIHARLCPSMDALMILDEDSSNGTFWNRMRLPGGTPQPLKDGDIIAFGRANFLVRIIKAPSSKEPRTLI